MVHRIANTEAIQHTARAFYGAFVFACFLFWWLPSVLFRLFDINDPVTNWALWASALALVAFTAGYFLPPFRMRTEIPQWIVDQCEVLAWKATIWMAVPAVVLAVRFFLYRGNVAYGEGEGLSFLDQAVFYSHMFVAFLYLGCARDGLENRKRIIVAASLVTLPRLIISLHWGRFFLGQAVVPILFLAMARGWLRMNLKRWVGLALLASFIMFVPAFTRGYQFLAQDDLMRFFASGSSLKLFQDNRDLDLSGYCPPLFVSMTAQVVPYRALGVCTVDIWGVKGLPATLDRILAYNDPTAEGTLEGTGANYLLELYLSGGMAALLLGSIAFGFTNRCFIDWIGRRSLFAGIWAECISRSLFAPRSTIGYVYQRIPSLVLATLLIVLVIFVSCRCPRPYITSAKVRPHG